MTERQHAVLSASLLLLAFALVFLTVVAPALSLRADRGARLEELHAQRESFAQAAASIPELEQELRQLKSAQLDATGFLRESSPALAAAELQRLLKALIEASGGELISTQVMPGGPETPFAQVGIKAQLRADMNGLQGLLHALAGHEPALILDNVLIQPGPGGASRRNPERAGRLDVRFDVIGYLFSQEAQ
jgi:hypothetical protein